MVSQGLGEIAERLRRSTVEITSRARGGGSGIIVGSDGVVVTNAHVVHSSPLRVHLWDGSSFEASVEARDPRRDLAVLKIPTLGLPQAELGDSDKLRVGELVIAIGNPLGFIGALTRGIVHAIGPLPGLGPTSWIQADVRLAPGNSGGPLANAVGKVVGVNTMVAGGLGLSVPSASVARLLAKGPSQAPLGVVVRPVRVILKGIERLGLILLEVAKGGAAERASLMVGDVIVGIGGQPLGSIEDLELALEENGQNVRHLQFLRGDRSNIRTASVILESHSFAAA